MAVYTYPYTPEGTALSGVPTEQYFTYGDSANPDRLTQFGTKAITYNTTGCPLSYNGKSFTWSKGKLASVSSGAFPLVNTYTYTYDGYGRRTNKRQSTLVLSGTMPTQLTYDTAYYYDNNGRLIKESIINTAGVGVMYVTEKIYLYDESGVIGMVYTPSGTVSSTYYFQRNLQGDIVGIYDVNGNSIAKYAYDAYGNCTILSTTNSAIANANPFRYRGYYLDAETGFYFLNARYYSPEWRRFISPDDTAYLDPENVNGLNLYCYCGNDPINFVDPSGHDPEWWQWLISGLEIVGGIALCFVPGWQAFGATLIATGAGSLINGYLTEYSGGTFTGGWIGAQVAGFVSLLPVVGSVLGAFAGSVTTDIIDLGWNKIDWEKALWTGVLAYGLTFFPTAIGQITDFWHIVDPYVYVTNAYNSIVAGTASSITNVFWRYNE